VILAHRLLKNGLGDRRAYLLLTEAARAWLGLDPATEELVPHVERYEHLGDVRCFVWDYAGSAVAPEIGRASCRERV